MTTRVTIAACPSNNVTAVKLNSKFDQETIEVPAGEQRDVTIWGDDVLIVKETAPNG